jgi:hypothetical protein
MAKKSHILRHEEGDDFLLIGIALHETDYRASWILNQTTGLDFVRIENLTIRDQRQEEELEFSRYKSSVESSSFVVHLISNHTQNAFLAPEMKNVDFFLKISGEISPSELANLLTLVRKSEGLLLAFELNKKELRSLSRFVF